MKKELNPSARYEVLLKLETDILEKQRESDELCDQVRRLQDRCELLEKLYEARKLLAGEQVDGTK